jgi:hypothetical protein
METSYQGTSSFVPPTEASYQGTSSFVPPTEASYQGTSSFVPPMEASYQGTSSFVPPTEASYQGTSSLVPPPKKKILHPNNGHVERLRETSLCSNFQRNGDRAKYNLGIRGRLGREVAGQGEAAISVDDRKSRVKFR